MPIRNRTGSNVDLENACGEDDSEEPPDLATRTGTEIEDNSDDYPSQLSPTTSHLIARREDEDSEDDINVWIANYERKKFQVVQLFPIAQWLPIYLRHVMGNSSATDIASMGALPFSLRGDLIAGLTVGFMLVPQCLAFALLAGLPVQIGLYASFAPLVVYTLLGTIRQVQPGPTALMSLLTAQALDAMKLDDDASRIAGASLLALAVGLISILLGALRFGFVVDFMSHSVMAAFCSAAGVTIATSQLKHLLGITMPRKKYWWQTASFLLSHIAETETATVIMGGTILVVLLTLKQWKSAGSNEKRLRHPVWQHFPVDKTMTSFKTLKVVADLSAFAAVVVGWFWALAYRSVGVDSVKVVGNVEGEGFIFVAPGQGILDDVDWNSFLVTAAVMAVVGFLETMAVGGKFAMQARYDYDPNQELLALGIANVAGAVMSGYPTTGSFSRTAVNAMLGATSLVACALSAAIVFGAVYLLLPAIALLPLASLAPIIIQGAMGVISVHDFAVAWGASRAEFVVMVATFTTSLALTVKEGLLVGFVLSVLKTMNDLANPNLAICGRLSDNSFRDIRNFPNSQVLPNAVVVRMDARLSFANSRKMKEFCLRAVQVRQAKGDDIQYVIIDGKSINHVDLTGCEMLEVLAESLNSQDKKLILANLKGPVSKYLYSAGVPKVIQANNGHLCIDMDQAMGLVDGADPKQSADVFQELVRRVDTASLVLRANSGMACRGANFRACGNGIESSKGSPVASDKQPSPALVKAAAQSNESTAASTPRKDMSREITPSTASDFSRQNTPLPLPLSRSKPGANQRSPCMSPWMSPNLPQRSPGLDSKALAEHLDSAATTVSTTTTQESQDPIDPSDINVGTAAAVHVDTEVDTAASAAPAKGAEESNKERVRRPTPTCVGASTFCSKTTASI